MWWRLQKREYEAGKGEKNRAAMKAIVQSGRVPGILAHDGEKAVGWCSVAPREEYERLEKSRILKPVDGRPVWSVVCLFVDRAWRNRGVSVRLLEAAVRYVESRGGRIVEGYAVEPSKGRISPAFAFHGLASAYRRAGFEEVLRRSETRPIMRYLID